MLELFIIIEIILQNFMLMDIPKREILMVKLKLRIFGEDIMEMIFINIGLKYMTNHIKI
jgi:hypothetical protein